VKRERLLVWWGAALLFLALLGLGCWLVVLPARQAHVVVGEWGRSRLLPSVGSVLNTTASPDYTPLAIGDPLLVRSTAEAIDRLGGPEQAARKLALYARLPGCFASRREPAIELLGECGAPAIPALERLARASDPDVRKSAGHALERARVARPDHREPDAASIPSTRPAE
jgi:hypothetical protein